MKDMRGKKVGVFKPSLEEQGQPLNPSPQFRQVDPAFSYFPPGEGYLRESLAYLFDDDGFFGVPPTTSLCLDHPNFYSSSPDPSLPPPFSQTNPALKTTNSHMASVGSLQKFLEISDSYGDFSPSILPLLATQKVALFDLLLLNGDRNGGNILIEPLLLKEKASESTNTTMKGSSSMDMSSSERGGDREGQDFFWEESKKIEEEEEHEERMINLRSPLSTNHTLTSFFEGNDNIYTTTNYDSEEDVIGGEVEEEIMASGKRNFWDVMVEEEEEEFFLESADHHQLMIQEPYGEDCDGVENYCNSIPNSPSLLVDKKTFALTPIDHALILPTHPMVYRDNWCWLYSPHTKQPTTPDLLSFLLNLDIEGKIEEMREFVKRNAMSSPSGCWEDVWNNLRLSYYLLSEGLKNGLNLREVGLVIGREDIMDGGGHLDRSHFERIVEESSEITHKYLSHYYVAPIEPTLQSDISNEDLLDQEIREVTKESKIGGLRVSTDLLGNDSTSSLPQMETIVEEDEMVEGGFRSPFLGPRDEDVEEILMKERTESGDDIYASPPSHTTNIYKLSGPGQLLSSITPPGANVIRHHASNRRRGNSLTSSLSSSPSSPPGFWDISIEELATIQEEIKNGKRRNSTRSSLSSCSNRSFTSGESEPEFDFEAEDEGEESGYVMMDCSNLTEDGDVDEEVNQLVNEIEEDVTPTSTIKKEMKKEKDRRPLLLNQEEFLAVGQDEGIQEMINAPTPPPLLLPSTSGGSNSSAYELAHLEDEVNRFEDDLVNEPFFSSSFRLEGKPISRDTRLFSDITGGNGGCNSPLSAKTSPTHHNTSNHSLCTPSSKLPLNSLTIQRVSSYSYLSSPTTSPLLLDTSSSSSSHIPSYEIYKRSIKGGKHRTREEWDSVFLKFAKQMLKDLISKLVKEKSVER